MVSSDALVDRIHETPHRGVILTAGGGSGIFPLLMRRGGASATILDGGIPHGLKAVPRWLKLDEANPSRWPKAVSKEVARGLAMAAYYHARSLNDNSPSFGVGCTVSLAKNNAERAGREHRVYAAVQTDSMTHERWLIFPPNGNRLQEEEIVEKILLDLVAVACNIEDRCWQFDSDDGQYGSCYATATSCHHADLPSLLNNPSSHAYIVFKLKGSKKFPEGIPKKEFEDPANQKRAILSASFNPIHDGHRRMRAITSQRTGLPCHLELTLRNAAKLPLDYLSLQERLHSLRDETGFLIISNASTFVDKAWLFPNTTFAVGHDTAMRIMDSKYYGSSSQSLEFMYQNLIDLDASFLVFGRTTADNTFQTIDPTEPSCFPESMSYKYWSKHCHVVPESEFRQDVSSTSIREAMTNGRRC